MYVQSLTAFMGLWSSQGLLLQLSTGPEHKCYSILKNDTCHVSVIWIIKYQLNLFLKTTPASTRYSYIDICHLYTFLETYKQRFKR